MSILSKRTFMVTLAASLCLTTALAQSAEPWCTKETLADCYQEALQLYQNEEYGEAKGLLEQIIAIDAQYKKAAVTLKKCYVKLAQATIAKEREAQRLAEAKQKQEQEKKRQQKLEMKKLEEERLRQEKMEAQAQQEERDILAEQKEEMVEAGRTPLPEMQQSPSDGIYRIGIGDVLSISVWRNTDLDKEVIVRPDGVISYPLVGDLPAVGLTLTELDAHVTEALREYVRNPVVSVAMTRFGGTKIIALGEIKTPGVFSVPGGGNVIDIIALAGGFTKDAVRRSTFLIRGGLANPQVYRLNLARVFRGDLSQNIPLQASDIIYVPKTFIAHFNEAVSRLTPLLSNTLLGTTIARDLGVLDSN